MEHLDFTFLSDYTYNRVGYVDVDIDDLDALGLGETDQPDRRRAGASSTAPPPCRPSTASSGLVLGVDHMATRILAGDRETRFLEYLTIVPYYFWGAYNIHEMNSSTNVTRHPDLDDDKKSPARVFTANNTPAVRQLVRQPADADRGLRAQLRSTDASHGDAPSSTVTSPTRRTSTTSSVSWPRWGRRSWPTWWASARTTPNLKQIFSKSSPYSMLITEYIERCHHYEGFFTRDNVAALTAAAGADERYEHGHVFD